MSDLDSAELYTKSPYREAFSIVDRYVEDLESGIESGQRIELNVEKIENILLIGIGGSGIICDITAQLLRNAGINAEVTRNYKVKPGSWDLAIAISHSGNTAETLEPVLDLIEKRIKCVFITSNGILEKLGKKFKIPTAFIRGDVPPRYGFPNMLGAALGVIRKLNLMSLNIDFQKLRSFQSRIRENVKTDENPAKKLALKIAETPLPIIYVYDEVRNIGYRLKCQLNENAKIYCGFAEIPEALHNEIEGLPPNSLIILPRSSKESWEISKTIETLIKYLGEERCVSLRAESKEGFQEDLEFFLLVDYASLYLSILRKVDPLILPKVGKLRSLNKTYEDVLRRAREKLGEA